MKCSSLNNVKNVFNTGKTFVFVAGKQVVPTLFKNHLIRFHVEYIPSYTPIITPCQLSNRSLNALEANQITKFVPVYEQRCCGVSTRPRLQKRKRQTQQKKITSFDLFYEILTSRKPGSFHALKPSPKLLTSDFPFRPLSLALIEFFLLFFLPESCYF